MFNLLNYPATSQLSYTCEFNQSTVHVSTLDYKVGFQVQINSTDFFQGGAIKIKGQYKGHIYLTNCEFRGNYHGAIEISESARIVITNSTFEGNQYIESEFSTAVCDLESKYLEVVDSNFIGNLNCDTVARVSANQILIATSHFVSNNCSQTLSIDDAFLTNIKIDTDSVLINDCSFVNNHGSSGGGIVNYIYGHLLIFITNCEFTANHADWYGGAIYSTNEIIISNSSFTKNTARVGGAIYTDGKFVIVNCTYTNNFIKTPTNTKNNGAAILAVLLNQQEKLSIKSISIQSTVFTENFGCETVAIVGSKVQMDNVSFINNGMKQDSRNRGCLYLFNIRLDVTGSMTVSGNVGGGIYAIQSHIYINSTKKTVITNNTASSGGGIMIRDSELTIQAPVTISGNKVQLFGGGIYAYLSLVDFKSDYRSEGLISTNFAGQNGGGMFAIGSTIKLTRYFLIISSNAALLNGGGLYLQDSSKIYLFKKIRDWALYPINVRLELANNSARFGGGIFVADKSNRGDQRCQRQENQDNISVTQECFIQTIKLYHHESRLNDLWKILTNVFIINNIAKHGSALYGGLLDRCTVSDLAEVYDKRSNGVWYFKKTVVISKGATITSDPVQVVFCGEHNSSMPMIKTTKGEPFVISIKAIDQVGNPVNAIIHSSVITESGVGRLKEGQTEQMVSNQCTQLEYNVFSQDSSAQLELYADGPCTNLGISKQIFTITFLPCTCPIGLQPSQSQIECKCLCDKKLQLHQITNCSQQAGTIQLETNLWIGVANSTNGTGYIIHDCLFDYCTERPVNVSLNSFQERDRQCAFNRSGVLCGDCQQGLSLVLATSKCKECSNIHLLLLLPFALAGIALVAFILFFNITIATGTIYGLIIYSNLLPANYFSQPSVLTAFISWVNLDLGIETCFYNGMSSQAKVLLQLVFPAYLFLLIFLIIILCRYSNFFATLLSNRNPVAALCTLIFLSYSKLLQFIIAALQSTVLKFPDGSKQRVWLYDGNVQYFTPSHTPHFMAAAIIVTAGGLLTLQLFFAQWFHRCSKWKVMKWTRNTKYTAFIDVYHAPFTRKHRYWVGLLLFALIVYNSIASLARTPILPVLSMGCIAASLLMFKLRKNRMYKSWINNQLENAFLLNLIFLVFGTLYAKASETRNTITILANISMGVSAALFLIIICYHSYKYVYLPSRFHRRHKMQIKEIAEVSIQRFKRIPKRQDKTEMVTDQGGSLKTGYTAMRTRCWREQDLDILSPITTEDYRPAPLPSDPHPEVTYTIVETTS